MYMVLLLFKHFVVWKCDFLHMTCLKMTEAAELPEIATFFWAQQRRKAYSVRAVVNTPKKPRTAGGQSAWYFFVFFSNSFQIFPFQILQWSIMAVFTLILPCLFLTDFANCPLDPFGMVHIVMIDLTTTSLTSHDVCVQVQEKTEDVSNVAWRMCASAIERYCPTPPHPTPHSISQRTASLPPAASVFGAVAAQHASTTAYYSSSWVYKPTFT